MDLTFFIIAILLLGGYVLFKWFMRFNRITLNKFSVWKMQYETSKPFSQIGMAKALVFQSLHLAQVMRADIPNMGALTERLGKADPQRVINECLDEGLPKVVAILGTDAVMDLPARDVGMLLLVSMANTNSHLALQNFLSKYTRGVGHITCEDCHYEKTLVDLGETGSPNTTIYQCESCGKFVEGINFLTERFEGACACGGAVEPNASIFCPVCKSGKVKYEVRYPNENK